MRVPTSTYRLQLNADFKLAQLRELTDYFEALGVGDLYFSPIFQARPKSPHGYDVTNPAQFNREVGDEAEFEALSRELRERGIGLVLDIVPNHMAASEENPWWRDILENGACSLASHFFDVEWDAPGCDCHVVLPILGRELNEAIAEGELKLAYKDGELVLMYFKRALPIDPATYARVLRKIEGIDASLPAESEAIRHRRAGTQEEKSGRRAAAIALKQRLYEWTSNETNRSILENVAANIDKDELSEIIESQAYQLEFWQTGTRRINYRRFFDITDLAGVRVEDPDVFATTHSLILELVRTNQIDGVRVDHVDGLRDPKGYLEDLRNAVGDTYVLVEKILAPKEELREEWPIEGTTGYDFTGLLAGFHCEPDGLSRIFEDYAQRTGHPRFADIVYEKKKFVIEALFRGELRALTSELARIANLSGVLIPEEELRRCIIEVTAALEIYRTYINGEADAYDRGIIKQAVNSARHREPGVRDDAYYFFRRVVLSEELAADVLSSRDEFVANWQQFTGPAMAKGLEDTSFYTYHALIALSEVGARPDAITASRRELHEIFSRRARRWPYTLNATSTHDTKRS
ncbi:MAG TPA: malto-oligosyltrehalose synthase, partial [Longimicrobiales bacterium]|nr:malto-oligosyltrehalose synthase [Longimicrobiales bacterium]